MSSRAYSLIDEYIGRCQRSGTAPDTESFLAIERQARLFVNECIDQGIATADKCPVSIAQIDDTHYYYVKVVPPQVIVRVVTKDELLLMGYSIIPTREDK